MARIHSLKYKPSSTFKMAAMVMSSEEHKTVKLCGWRQLYYNMFNG